MTSIEWTDATWNPFAGCSVISPGCTNCYAMRMAARIERMKPDLAQYQGLTKQTRAGPVWTGKIGLADHSKLTEPLRRRKPQRIFVNSMSDLFHETIPDHWIDEIFAVMALSRQHTFQILTKRADLMREYLTMPLVHENVSYAGAHMAEDAVDRIADTPWPLPNVWLGVSVEDQQRANERIPSLLATPAAVRWISAEPLLGRIDLDEAWLKSPRLDWVVVGGESGPNARPMHPHWVRRLRNQCVTSGVPFFFKQWGAYRARHACTEELGSAETRIEVAENGDWVPYRRRVSRDDQQMIDRFSTEMIRTKPGEKARSLDGRVWEEFPKAKERMP
ncbi:MAG: phage Gp37/Gp68 family protein [Alphaproteobacteria bacterium]|nr:MAG: phage Gp37/Gp68 family protein [Alphaproteobacteria bacterium]